MSAESRFLDTNVLVYLFDSDAPDKQARARRLLEDEAENVVLSTRQIEGNEHRARYDDRFLDGGRTRVGNGSGLEPCILRGPHSAWGLSFCLLDSSIPELQLWQAST